MSFWGHLEVLRGVLWRIVAITAAIAVGLFIGMHWIFDNVILAPCNSNFPLYQFFDYILANTIGGASEQFQVTLINIKLASQFYIHISTSCWLALTIAFPFIIYQLWGFISPALYENEKRGVKSAFFFGNIMFYLGIAVGYYLVFPLTLRFLGTYQVSSEVANQISLQSYISMFTWMILIMGVVFEMPSLAAILSRLGILTRNFLKKYRRHAFVVLLMMAAFITPSGDPFTLMAVGLPLYGLYELSILVCRDIN